MTRKIKILFLLSLFCSHINAQELQAKVTVNASHINTTVDKKVFNTLQSQLSNFLNSRKFTEDQFKEYEKVQCNFILNLQSIVEPNVYKATLIIQAARPVFNSSYQTALVSYQDQDFTFRYVEYQSVDFNDNRVQGTDALSANLTAILAYYSYIILGLDYDSFSPKGGAAFFQKAQNVVNNAPEANNVNGWKAFDGLRNRYWLAENLISSRNNIIHDVIYSYYRAGLDKLVDSESEAQLNLIQALTQLQAFNREVPNTMFVDFFMQNKLLELVGIFKKATTANKNKVVDLLTSLDVSNASRYKEELR